MQQASSQSWTLITGPTAGIGYELARLFAADKQNLILTARNEARLRQIAAEFERSHQIQTRVIVQDLAAPNAAANIFEAVRDLQIDILVNNAGFGSMGPFLEEDVRCSLDMMHCNMDALLHLTRLFVPSMLQRNHGRILNVASTAAFQPGPFMATYYATKAFVFSFSYALADELRGTGVYVTTLCPGMTKTEFQERAGSNRGSGTFLSMSAEAVARAGYRGLLQGKRVVIPGLQNKLLTFMARRAPISLSAKVVRKINGR